MFEKLIEKFRPYFNMIIAEAFEAGVAWKAVNGDYKKEEAIKKIQDKILNQIKTDFNL